MNKRITERQKLCLIQALSVFGCAIVVTMCLSVIVQSLHAQESSEIAVGLIQAAKDNDLEAVQNAITAGVDTNTQDKNGGTALMWAAYHGHTEIMALLLEHGANIEVKSNLGNTALMAAAINGHTSAVKFLLESGANVDEQNQKGETALNTAETKGHTEIISVLQEATASQDAPVAEAEPETTEPPEIVTTAPEQRVEPPSQKPERALSMPVIIGAIVGLVLLAGIIVLIWILLRKKPAQSQQKEAHRCGVCGEKRGDTTLVRDKKGNTGYFCDTCNPEWSKKLKPDSRYSFFLCSACSFKIFGGSPIDKAGVCSECDGNLDQTYTNLENDQPIGQGPMFSS